MRASSPVSEPHGPRARRRAQLETIRRSGRSSMGSGRMGPPARRRCTARTVRIRPMPIEAHRNGAQVRVLPGVLKSLRPAASGIASAPVTARQSTPLERRSLRAVQRPGLSRTGARGEAGAPPKTRVASPISPLRWSGYDRTLSSGARHLPPRFSAPLSKTSGWTLETSWRSAEGLSLPARPGSTAIGSPLHGRRMPIRDLCDRGGFPVSSSADALGLPLAAPQPSR